MHLIDLDEFYRENCMRRITAEDFPDDDYGVKSCDECGKLWSGSLEIDCERYLSFPTVDAVKVIRCKDCAYWDTDGYTAEFDLEGLGWCDRIERDTHKGWYCADGERREDE